MIRAMGDIQVNLDLADSIKVGILSDTHGLLRPEVERILEKCDKIVHAGDFDNKETARRLEQIAPTYMVRGNNDLWLPYGELRTARFEIGGVRFYMVHNREEVGEVPEETDVVVFGHTHQYYEKKENGRLWLNPGSCGRARFSLPLTMAVMTIHEGRWRVHRVRIDA